MKFKLNTKKKPFASTKSGAESFFVDKKSKIGILLLHGFTSTPYQFKEIVDFFANKGFTVLAPLIAGHGTNPDDLLKTTINDWKKSVEDAYKKLKEKTEKIFILGNSFGGNLAFYLARKFPESTIGVVSLGTPIKLRFELIIKIRLYAYGRFKKYYHKPRRIYRTDYTDMADEISYPVIPIKSLQDFLRFIKEETIPNLKNVKAPTLVLHANHDYVIDPKSAIYIYEHLGSSYKRLHLFNSNRHSVVESELRQELMEKSYQFLQEIV